MTGVRKKRKRQLNGRKKKDYMKRKMQDEKKMNGKKK